MAKGMTHDWGRQHNGPWWRFVPWSQTMGYVSLAVGFLLMVEALSSLFRGNGNSAFGVAVEILLAVVSFVLIVQSVDGIRILRRRNATGRH